MDDEQRSSVEPQASEPSQQSFSQGPSSSQRGCFSQMDDEQRSTSQDFLTPINGSTSSSTSSHNHERIQNLLLHDTSLQQLMKEQAASLAASLDRDVEELKNDFNHKISLMLKKIPEQVETAMQKIQRETCQALTRDIQLLASLQMSEPVGQASAAPQVKAKEILPELCTPAARVQVQTAPHMTQSSLDERMLNEQVSAFSKMPEPVVQASAASQVKVSQEPSSQRGSFSQMDELLLNEQRSTSQDFVTPTNGSTSSSTSSHNHERIQNLLLHDSSLQQLIKEQADAKASFDKAKASFDKAKSILEELSKEPSLENISWILRDIAEQVETTGQNIQMDIFQRFTRESQVLACSKTPEPVVQASAAPRVKAKEILPEQRIPAAKVFVSSKLPAARVQVQTEPPQMTQTSFDELLLNEQVSAFSKMPEPVVQASAASQVKVSQEPSSQRGSFSQMDELLLNEQRFATQDFLTPAKHKQDVFTSSSSPATRWLSALVGTSNSQVSEELEKRFVGMATSLSKFGMMLEDIQSDIRQANRGTNEENNEDQTSIFLTPTSYEQDRSSSSPASKWFSASFGSESERMQYVLQDTSFQQLIKEKADLKASLDGAVNSMLEEVQKVPNLEKVEKISQMVTDIAEQVETARQNIQREIFRVLRDIQAASEEEKAMEDEEYEVAEEEEIAETQPRVRKGRSQRTPWTKEEEDKLIQGFALFGANRSHVSWKRILEFGQGVFNKKRSPEDLRNKWNRMHRTR